MASPGARAKQLSPELTFVVIAGVCGSLLAVISPPLRWGDENTHLVQAYRLSELNFATSVADGGMSVSLPRGVGKLMLVLALEHRANPGGESAGRLARMRAIEASPDDRRAVGLVSASYSPLSYAPPALGIALARTFTRSVLLQIYGARLANLSVWMLLVWTAIRTTPLFKLAFAVLALTPMSIFLAGSCAVDPLANGLAFLWSAWVIRLAVAQRPSWAILALLAPLAAALALVKLVYAPLVLLLLAVPADRFGGWRARAAATSAMLATSALGVVAWVAYARATIAAVIAYRGNAALAANRALLIDDPPAVARLVAEAVLHEGRSWVYQLSDTHWGSPMAPELLLWLWLAAVVSATFAETRVGSWPALGQRGTALLASLMVFVSVALCAFLFWSREAGEIEGVQGRYAIPLLPALLIACCPPAHRPLTAGARTLLARVAVATVVAILAHTVYRGTQLYR